MVFGWRKAFCNQQQSSSHIPTPRLRSKFGFFSNPSTPRIQSPGGSGRGIGCRSAASTAAANPSLPTSPKLHCKTTSNATPRTSNSSTPKLLSNPSSPKSSSSSHGGVSLLRATLLLNKSNNNRCGICLQRLNSGQINSTAIFTAECSHSFHLSCAVKLDGKRCPFCSATWNYTPRSDSESVNIGSDPWRRPEIREIKTGKSLRMRVYNDDETLAYSPVSLAHFNSIPESDENDDVEEANEFPGFFSDSSTTPSLSGSIPPISGNLEVKLLPESAVVETGKRIETHVVMMKLKATSSSSSTTDAARASRPSIDLVTVLDLSRSGGANLRTVKHAMRLVISLLREMDRLSIVVFSSGSKRLMPLRRMTDKGRRSARRIVDALVGIETNGGGMSVNDALKKAVKVVEDRRERNPSVSILVLSDGQDQSEAVTKAKLNSATRVPFVVSTTRFSRLEIPVHSVWIASSSALHHAPLRDAFTERIASRLNVVLNDVKLNLGLVSGSPLTEISAVYSLTGRLESFGPGSAVIVGDLFAEEEREYLVEFKVPTSTSGSNHVIMSVRSSVVDPSLPCPKEKRFLIPSRPQTVRSASSSIERLRNVHLVCRAVADSRKLVERDDVAGAYKLLTTARSNASSDDCLLSLDAELAELSRLKPRTGLANRTEEKPEQLTPTSAWKAAEKLAKVAIMRKHLNRVSDMHGLENARF